MTETRKVKIFQGAGFRLRMDDVSVRSDRQAYMQPRAHTDAHARVPAMRLYSYFGATLRLSLRTPGAYSMLALVRLLAARGRKNLCPRLSECGRCNGV
jgi:hypothetical protein